MKRLFNLIEVISTLTGLIWFFAPPSLQEIPRGVSIVLLVLASIVGVFGAYLMAAIIRSQFEPPYSG
jgi:hypothetical protein